MAATPPSTATPPTTPSTPDPSPAAATQSAADSQGIHWKSLFEDMKPVLKALKWLESHPWVLPSYLAAVVAIKVLSVAEGDIATAGVILGSGGFLGLASVVILAILPSAVASLFLITATMTGATAGANIKKSAETEPRSKRNTLGRQLKAISAPALATIVFGLMTAIVAPWIVLVIVAVLAMWLGAAMYFSNRKEMAQNPSATPSIGGGGRGTFTLFLLVALPITLFVSAWNPTSWLPVERIMVGGTWYTGYVLSDDGHYATILVEDTRAMKITLSENMTDRKRCDLSEPFPVALPWLGNPPAYGLSCKLP